MRRWIRALLWGLVVYATVFFVLSLFRVAFLAGMTSYLTPATTMADVLAAVRHGAQLSMQTTGIVTLFVWMPALLLLLLSVRAARAWLLAFGAVVFIALSVLFVARFPYYRQFHSGYNQFLFNTVNDDVSAIFWSLVQEFYLPVRLFFALLLAYGLYRAYCRFVAAADDLADCLDLSSVPRALVLSAALCTVFYGLSRLSYHGGGWGWETGHGWENVGITRDALLNEAILDDPQAIYRAWTLQNRLLACNGLDFTVDEIRRLAAKRAGRPSDTDDLDVYLMRTAQGARIAAPKHIFIIIGESYAVWPHLPQYADLHIADGMKALIKRADSASCLAILPNGSSTVSAVTGIVTGFADANLYLTTMPESFAAPYPTASAPIMKRLGYTTHFWYAGASTWERIEPFVTAQGYDTFTGSGAIPAQGGSVWGVDDEYLFDAVLNGVRADAREFHVILNVANHSPFTVDVEAKGFDAAAVRRALPADAKKDDDLVRALGHYWYSDREMARFIREAEARFPGSLFVVLGDHADRYHVSKTPRTYEQFAVPLFFIGAGVQSSMLSPKAAGSQIDVVPTIVEWIAPQGFAYEAVGESLTTNTRGVNYMLWVTHDEIGKADTSPLVAEWQQGEGTPPPWDDAAQTDMQDYINAIRSLSWWRPQYGAVLDAEKLIGRE